MKKLSVIFALIVGLFVFKTMDVRALTEAELKEKVLQTVKIGDSEFKLTNEERKIVETYFEQNEISDKDATYIAGKIDEAIAIAKKQGNANFTKYPQSVKNELKDLVTEISKNTEVKATLTKDGLTVKNTDGSEVIITSLVKQTGYESSKTAIIIAISFLIVAVGTGLVIKQVKAN